MGQYDRGVAVGGGDAKVPARSDSPPWMLEFAAKRAKNGQDEIAIALFCKTNPGAVDQLGRSLCTSASGKGY